MKRADQRVEVGRDEETGELDTVNLYVNGRCALHAENLGSVWSLSFCGAGWLIELWDGDGTVIDGEEQDNEG